MIFFFADTCPGNADSLKSYADNFATVFAAFNRKNVSVQRLIKVSLGSSLVIFFLIFILSFLGKKYLRKSVTATDTFDVLFNKELIVEIKQHKNSIWKNNFIDDWTQARSRSL